MGAVFKQVKNRDRSTLRKCGPCLACHAPDIQYGRGGGRGLASAHVTYGDAWLDRKIVEPMSTRSTPFVFIDWNNASYDPERRQRVGPEVHGFPVLFKISTFDLTGEIESINGVAYSWLKPYVCPECQIELQAKLE